jgi:hypothetical protein
MALIVQWITDLEVHNQSTPYDGLTSAGIGSLGIVSAPGTVGLFQNTDGAFNWVQFLTTGGGSSTFDAAMTWSLVDNTAAAWTIGTGGLTNMLVFNTTNNSERLAVGARMTTTDGIPSGTARVVGGLCLATMADSGTITGNGAAQSFDQSYIIPANTLGASSTIRVVAVVRRVNINAADTATVGLRIGGTTYVTSAAVAALVGERCYLVADFTARAAAGAAVAVVGAGRAGWNTAGSSQLPSGTTANLATNGALTVDVQITMPNNANNTAVLEQFRVDIV